MSKKKVYFYKLDILNDNKKIKKSNKEKMDYIKLLIKKELPNKKMLLDELDKIHLDLEEAGKIVNYNEDRDIVETELLEIEHIEEADYIFFRMGKKKDISNVGERDEKTLELETIKKKPNKIFEIFTYFYIFFDTGVVAHLNVQSGPSIEYIKEIKKATNTDDRVTISILPIMSKDVIKSLKHKKRLSKLNFEFCIPSDSLLDINKGIGLDENTFDSLRSDNNIKLSVSISANRKDKVFNVFNPGIAEDVKEKFMEKVTSNKNLNKAKITAETNDTKSREFNLIEDKFYKNVTINYESEEGNLRRLEIKEKLLKGYMKEREDIKDFIS